jgi:quercetin dioxygenase-like cupin family protein
MLQIKNYLEAEWMDWQGMHGSQAHGLPLVKQDNFAADMLHFLPNEKTSLHTHPGNHILFVVEGGGFLTYGDEEHPLVKGSCYLVPGITNHRVSADERGMYLLSIADTHRSVDSEERTEIIEN